MIFFKKSILIICCVLFSVISSISALSFEYGQKLFKEHQTSALGFGISAAVAVYIAHAIYLDTVINNKDSLWHWSLHHIKNGTIDQGTLLAHVEELYPDLKSFNPLTAIFAATHAAQMEIDSCLALLGILKSLKVVNLEWLISETIPSLDKKVESLYILKITLAYCTTETRTRCKKRCALEHECALQL